MIESNLISYWNVGGSDTELAEDIVSEALADPPTSAKTAARCLQVMRRTPLHESVQRRIDMQFVPLIDDLRKRLDQVHRLANRETPPEAIVEILGEEAEGLDLTEFDSAALHKERSRHGSTARAAGAFLDAFGWERLPESAAHGLKQAIEYLRSQEKFEAQALLVGPDNEGFVLGLNLALDQTGKVRSDEQIDQAMATQAQTALHAVAGLEEAGGVFGVEWSLPRLEGHSLGLATVVAAFVCQRRFEPDPLTAATGKIEVGGAVVGVEGIEAKIAAATEAGIRRILVPEENRKEAEAASASLSVEALFVSEVASVPRVLSRVESGTQLGSIARQRVIRGFASQHGFDVVEERPLEHGYQFKLSNLNGPASIDLYDSGRVVVGGGGAAKAAAENLVAERLPRIEAEPRSPLTIQVANADRRERLRKALIEHDAVEADPREHEQWRLKLERGPSGATVVQYSSGKCVLQGSAPAWDALRAVMVDELGDLGGAEALKETPALERVRARRAESADEPWIGTDESGKGDFFGPLVSAAVYVDPTSTAEQLEAIGVADSKRLSDKKVRELAPQVRHVVGKGEYVTAIHPPRFNSLYREMRSRGGSLNTMLAWGHTRSIENLLLKGLRPRYAIVDQFADTRFIKEALLREAREVDLDVLQFPKAELDLAVAAASILAREAFLDWLAKASAAVGLELPKGANPHVVEAARELVRRVGEDKLGDYAKLSFKTAREALAN